MPIFPRDCHVLGFRRMSFLMCCDIADGAEVKILSLDGLVSDADYWFGTMLTVDHDVVYLFFSLYNTHSMQ
jgi:hypothetical protein